MTSPGQPETPGQPRPGRRFGAIPVESMTAEQRAVAESILAGPRGGEADGRLRGPFEALLHSPDLADVAQRVGVQVRFRSSLPDDLKELAIITVARRWTAQYEWFAHRRLALAAGLDPAIADTIAAGERPTRGALGEDGAAVYDFVTALLETGDVPDGTFDAVCPLG